MIKLGMPSWILKYPKVMVGFAVGRKIMNQVPMSSINGRRDWWSIDGRGEEARGQNGH